MTPEEARATAEKLFGAGHRKVVVKSQIHAGGRGKGTFKSGLPGGVKVCSSAEDVFQRAQAMLGQVLVTKQTGPEGRRVSKLLIEAASIIKKEFYVAVLLDRAVSRPIVMASTEGGMDIEEVAARTPEKILRETINPALGMMPFQARKLAATLGLKGDLINAAAKSLLDVGGGASQEQVSAAFKIILSDPHVRGILVNIFGGIMDCNVIASGIVAAVRETGLKLPLVVRLEGNNVQAGKKTLAESGLTIVSGDSMADAAQKIVKAVGKG